VRRGPYLRPHLRLVQSVWLFSFKLSTVNISNNSSRAIWKKPADCVEWLHSAGGEETTRPIAEYRSDCEEVRSEALPEESVKLLDPQHAIDGAESLPAHVAVDPSLRDKYGGPFTHDWNVAWL
jgi:hypothetical protein